MKIIISSIIVMTVISIILSACTWTTGGDELIFPEINVSYLLHVKPFFEQNCSYAPCHSGFDMAGGYAITEYHNIMAIAGFIAPANPNGSRLVQILEGTSPHFTNFYRGNIKDNYIKGIRQWIKEGAINN